MCIARVNTLTTLTITIWDIVHQPCNIGVTGIIDIFLHPRIQTIQANVQLGVTIRDMKEEENEERLVSSWYNMSPSSGAKWKVKKNILGYCLLIEGCVFLLKIKDVIYKNRKICNLKWQCQPSQRWWKWCMLLQRCMSISFCVQLSNFCPPVSFFFFYTP